MNKTGNQHSPLLKSLFKSAQIETGVDTGPVQGPCGLEPLGEGRQDGLGPHGLGRGRGRRQRFGDEEELPMNGNEENGTEKAKQALKDALIALCGDAQCASDYILEGEEELPEMTEGTEEMPELEFEEDWNEEY